MSDLPCFNGDSHSRSESTAIHQYKAERPMDDSDSQNHPTGISVVVDEI